MSDLPIVKEESLFWFGILCNLQSMKSAVATNPDIMDVQPINTALHFEHYYLFQVSGNTIEERCV